MSGRRTKSLRKRVALGALAAYSAFGLEVRDAQAQASAAKEKAPPPSNAELVVRRFAIPAGPLGSALRDFESASGLIVRRMLPVEVLDVLQTAGASGMLTNEQALTQMLEGTGVQFRLDGRRSVVVSMQVMSDTIDVRAAAPSISSPKFTQPLLETPRTVSVISEEIMRAQRATTLRDVLRNTPGITFQAGEGGGGLPGDTFSLRGFSSGNDISVDGVREVGAYSRDAFNLEQVEVLKGPAGAAAGRGATGGSINLVSKTAKLDELAHASLAAGNAGYSRVTIDTNLPLRVWPDSAFRLNAMWNESKVAGRGVVENSGWGLAPAFALGIGRTTRLDVSYQHLRQDNVPDYGLPYAALGATPEVDQSNFYGLADYDYEEIRSDVATVSVDRHFASAWTLRNISRWADNHRDSAITSPRPPNRQLQQRLMDHGQLANQTSLSGGFVSGAIHHDVVAGLELGRESTFSRRQAQTTNQPLVDITSPNPGQLPFGPMPANNGNPEDTRLGLLGLYAFDTLQLGARWEATAGLRYDAVATDFMLTNVATGAVTELERDDRVLSWSAGVVFKPIAKASVYASAGTSFNPSVEAGATGAGLSDVPTAANNVNLEPEKARNFEVGGKWELGDGRAIVTGAVFRTEKTNARTRNATTDAFVLAGEQRVDGVEVGVNGRLADGWNVLAGYAFLDSEFVASANPAEEGAQLAFVPEHSFNVWTDVRLPRRFAAGAGAQYMDAVFRNAANTAQVPSYWLMTAMASWDATPHLTLRFNVNNLTDAAYVDRVGGGHYIPGPGRSFVVSAEVDF